MAERLYGAAVELAGLSGRERVLDLFCGIGTIALALALDAGEVWGVEIVEEAVADAIENARLNGDRQRALLRRRRAHSRCGRCSSSRASPTWWWSTRRAPGLSQKVVRRVLEAEAQRIVYVSCNPTTLAPNARQMVDAGYELKTRPAGRHVPADAAHRGVALLERALARRPPRPRRARPPRWRAPCTGTARRCRAPP